MSEVLEKVKIIKKRNPDLIIEIDWWINWETVKEAEKVWVDISVAWSYVFWNKNRKEAISSLI